MTEVPVDNKGYEEILLIDQSQRYYKKCIVYQDKLVGAILMGDKSEFAEFKALIEDETELSEKRAELLRSKSSSKPMIGELVCSCGNVGTGNIQEALNNNCSNFNELCKTTGAGLGCGSCKPEVKNMLDNHLMKQFDNLSIR